MATTVPQKLQMKSGLRAVIINAPSGYLDQLNPLPEGFEIVESPEGQFDFVQVFVNNMNELQELLPVVLKAVKYDALLWITYPKGSAKAGMDINRDSLRIEVEKHQLSATTLVSIDDTWSALRFRPSERVGR